MSISLLVLTSLVYAQEFSVKQAQDYAVDNYYLSVNAGIDIKKSKSKIWEITAMGLPQAELGGSYRYALDLEFDFDLSQGIPPGQDFIAVFAADNITQGRAQVNQLLFDGSYVVGLQAAKKYHEFSKAGKDKTDNDVRNMVASSYYFVLVTEENLKVLESSFETLEKSYEDLKVFFDQGFLEETELDQLDLMKSDMESSIQSAKQTKDVALKMLKLNMGLELEDTLYLMDSLVNIVEQINMEALLAKGFDQIGNPDLRLMEVQRDLLALDLKRYKWERLPTIASFYQAQGTAYQFEWDWLKDASWYDQQNIGLSIRMPIWSSGKQASVIKQAQFELTKMENNLEYAKKAMSVQYKNALNNLTSKSVNFNNAKRSLSIADKIYNRTQIKHKEGLSSSFELSQMKNQSLQSQGKYIQALLNLLNAKSDLDKLKRQ
jgi:outer membrane protein TolC